MGRASVSDLFVCVDGYCASFMVSVLVEEREQRERVNVITLESEEKGQQSWTALWNLTEEVQVSGTHYSPPEGHECEWAGCWSLPVERERERDCGAG